MMTAIGAGEVMPDYIHVLMIVNSVLVTVLFYVMLASVQRIKAFLGRLPRPMNSLLLCLRIRRRKAQRALD